MWFEPKKCDDIKYIIKIWLSLEPWYNPIYIGKGKMEKGH